jgi:hypothetical protein
MRCVAILRGSCPAAQELNYELERTIKILPSLGSSMAAFCALGTFSSSMSKTLSPPQLSQCQSNRLQAERITGFGPVTMPRAYHIDGLTA